MTFLTVFLHQWSHWDQGVQGNLLAIFLFPLFTTFLLGMGALWKTSEKLQINILQTGMIGSSILIGIISIIYVMNGFHPIHTHPFLLFKSEEYEFSFSLHLDSVSYPFLVMIGFFGNIVSFLSYRCMHREPGIRRFLFVISFFITAMYLAVLGSNLDMLFSGWELVGLSSYLLIAFYWEKDQPVVNAQRVYLVYRICDLGLLLGAFLFHHVWTESSLFSQMGTSIHLENQVQSLPLLNQWFLGSLIALAALGKSAQFPFLTWLPKALEGPTPSSAVFYGALSIHLGVYLLIRLEPIWQLIPGFAFFIGSMGLLSAVLASSFGRLQTTIKGQIAYASSAQVGVMFFEMALGLNTFVLIHFVANALYRGFQLLSAPSILADQLQLQSARGGVIYRSAWFPARFFPKGVSESLYLFNLNEGYIDAFFLNITQRILGWIRSIFLPLLGAVLVTVVLGYLMGYFEMPLAYVLIVGSLFFSVTAYEKVSHPFRVVLFIFLSQILPVFSAAVFRSSFQMSLLLYCFSLSVSLFFSFYALHRIFRSRKKRDLYHLKGLFHLYPNASALFFVAAITMVGIPLTFTFVGEDLVFHHLVPHSGLCSLIVCLVYVLNGLSMIRLFSRTFLGSISNTGSNSVPIQNFGLPGRHSLLLFILFILLEIAPFALWRN